MSNLISLTLYERTISNSYLSTWSFPQYPQESISETFLQNVVLKGRKLATAAAGNQNSSSSGSDGSSDTQQSFLHLSAPSPVPNNDTDSSSPQQLLSSDENLFVCIASNVFYLYYQKPSEEEDNSTPPKLLLLETKDYHLPKYHTLMRQLFSANIRHQWNREIVSPTDNLLEEFLTVFGKGKLKSVPRWGPEEKPSADASSAMNWDASKFSSPHEYKIELLQQELKYTTTTTEENNNTEASLSMQNWLNLWTAVMLKKKIVIRISQGINTQQQYYRVANMAMALNCLAWHRANTWIQCINIGSEENLSTHHIYGDFTNQMSYDLLIELRETGMAPLIHLNPSQLQAFERTKYQNKVQKILQEHTNLDVQTVSHLNKSTKNVLANLTDIEDLSFEKLLSLSQQNGAEARFLFSLASAENLNQ